MTMWVASTEKRKWFTKTATQGVSGVELLIGEESGKPLYGFGCCLSEICAKAVLSLDIEKCTRILDDLFSSEGCGFSFCRLPIGANDFAESWYSYDETDGDYELKNFSITRDEQFIIPLIREVQKRVPQLMLFASPWSPPTWMKFPKVNNYGTLVKTPENMKAYARYFRKYLDAYAEKGIVINQIHFQNEMFSSQKFPSCVWDGETCREFLADYLIPEIQDKAAVWFGTVNGPETDERYLTTRHNQYLNYVMHDEKCRKAIKGASFQWAGKFGIIQTVEDYPELDLINSECECGDGENTWQYAMYSFEMLHHYLRYGAKACVYWNMALDNDGYSSWGWRQNSLVSVANGDYVYNPEFWLMKHFSHYVKRGAVVLGTKGSFSSNATIFRNPDGSRVAVLMNPFDSEFTVSIDGKSYPLEARSFNTILL